MVRSRTDLKYENWPTINNITMILTEEYESL